MYKILSWQANKDKCVLLLWRAVRDVKMDFSSSGKEPRHGNTKSGSRESIGFFCPPCTAQRGSSDFSSQNLWSLSLPFFLQIRGEIRLQERWVWMDMSCMECRKELRKHTNVRRYFRKPTSCFCKYPDDITDLAHVTNNPMDPNVLCKIS